MSNLSACCLSLIRAIKPSSQGRVPAGARSREGSAVVSERPSRQPVPLPVSDVLSPATWDAVLLATRQLADDRLGKRSRRSTPSQVWGQIHVGLQSRHDCPTQPSSRLPLIQVI